MGAIISYFSGGGGRTDDPDPVTGLTSRDVFLVRQSWSHVKKDLTGYGVKLLLAHFEKYPKDVEYFPFRDIKPLEKLRDNKKFHAHCNSVMHAVDSIIENLTDTELLVEILVKIGNNHKRRNVPTTTFTNLKGVLLDFLAPLNNKETMDSWRKALDAAFGVIGKEL